MHEENFLSSWSRWDKEGKVEEKGKFCSGAKQEENKIGKRKVEGEKEAVELGQKQKIRLESLTQLAVSEWSFEGFSDSGVVTVGNVWDFSMCVLAVPPAVSVVTALLSDVSVMCVVVSNTKCDFAQPQTCSFS